MIKKIFISIIISITILSSFASLTYANNLKDEEMIVFNQIKESGYSKIYVDLDSEKSVLKIDINEGDFIRHITNFFVLLRNNYDSNEYAIYLYDMDNKVFEVWAKKGDIDKYILGDTSEVQFHDVLEYKDKRSIEEKLIDDIELFDFLVYGVKIDEKKAVINLIYTGENEEEIIEDLPNIHLLTVQYAPYIEKTIINVENHVKEKHLEFEMETKDVISLLKEEISYGEYYDKANISIKEDGSILSGFNKFGTLDWIFIAIVIIFAIGGLLKGFIRSIFGVLSYVAALIGAYLLSPMIVNILKGSEGIIGFIHDKIYSSNIDQNILNLKLNSIGELSGNNPILDPLLKDAGGFLSSNERIIDLLTYIILTAVITFILFIIIKIIVSAIGKSIHKKMKGSFSAKIDKMLGFAAGLIIGVFNVALFVMIATPFIATSSNSSIIEFFDKSSIIEKVISIIF